MSRLNKNDYPKDSRKVKVLQFGLNRYVKGTTLTAVNSMNGDGVFDAGVICILSNPSEQEQAAKLKEQDYMYTILRQGLLDGESFEDNSVIESLMDIVDPYTDFQSFISLSRLDTVEFVFLNTHDEEKIFAETDTNLRAPKTFIGKLLAFLRARYDAFGGDITKGFHFIPSDKGYTDANEFKDMLVKLAKACRLPSDYINWITYSNTYAKCLIDRIIEEADPEDVAKADLVDYEDEAAIRTEHFYTWIIEGSLGLDKVFPAETATDIEFTDDITPYIERSDRLRGGARLALIATKEPTVSEAFKEIEQFVKDYLVYEAGPTVDLVDVELEFYADSLYERYENPYFVIDNGPRYKKYLKQALLPVIFGNKELAKRTLLILAYFVIDDNIDLGADPDFVKIDTIPGATEFLTQAIEDVKALGFVGAVKKYF